MNKNRRLGFFIFLSLLCLLVALLLVLDCLKMSDQVGADTFGYTSDVVEQVVQQTQFLCKQKRRPMKIKEIASFDPENGSLKQPCRRALVYVTRWKIRKFHSTRKTSLFTGTSQRPKNEFKDQKKELPKKVGFYAVQSVAGHQF